MTVNLDSQLPEGPLLASGKATEAGETVAAEFFEINETIKILEKRKAVLRGIILDAATEVDPKAKFFPAGEHIIKISRSERRTIPVTEVEKQRPDLFEALKEAELVTITASASVTVT
jgi:hypothetical protein